MVPRTLIVGVGGTGALALAAAKTLFNEQAASLSGRLEPDPVALLRLPANVRLLHIDTVGPDPGAGALLDEGECVRLSLRDPAQLLQSSSNDHLRAWFPSMHLAGQTLALGAAQIRPLGRLALHAQIEAFVERLRQVLNELTDRARLREASAPDAIDSQGVVEVYVLASLCGGTGSALFLDVATLIREELKNAIVRVYGVFLMPGPFQGRGATELVKPNAYAALKEIDHLAMLGPGEFVETDFGTRRLRLTRSPFDLVYLVDSLGESYDTTVSVSQLARQMAYLPFLMSSSEMGKRVREMLHNLIPQLENGARVHGKRAAYASFGVATLETPPHVLRQARRNFELALFDALVSPNGRSRSLEDFEREARTSLTVPRVLGWPQLTLRQDPRVASLNDIESTYGERVGDAVEYSRVTAMEAVAAAVEPLRARIRRVKSEAALQVGSLRAAQADCRAMAEQLLFIRRSLLDEQADAERLTKIDAEQQARWTRCQKAYAALFRRSRAPAVQHWQAWVNDQVLPARSEAAAAAVVRSAIGALRDELMAVEQWCDAAIAAVEGAREQLSGRVFAATDPPTSFSRYFSADALKLEPDAALFLREIDLERLITTPEQAPRVVIELLAHADRFADDVFAAALVREGDASATRLFLAGGDTVIDEMRRFSAPLWSFVASAVPKTHAISLLGVDRHGMAALAHRSDLEVALTPWWDRVVQLQIRAGVPLFALTCLPDLWRAYASEPNRSKLHLDARWTSWLELPSHDFPRAISERFAQAVALGMIAVDGPVLHCSNGAGAVELGRRFLEAFDALSRRRDLLAFIGRSFDDRRPAASELESRRTELWQRFLQGPLEIEDRPLVEALCRRLDRLAQP